MKQKSAPGTPRTAIMWALILLLPACQLALNLKKDYPPERDGSTDAADLVPDRVDTSSDQWQDPDGEGVPGLCTPGTAECQGDVLAVCNAEGTGWITLPCEHGCNGERLDCNACRPATTFCEGGELVTCDANGLGEFSTSCPLGCNGDAYPNRCFVVNPSNVNDAEREEPLLCAGTGVLDLAADAVINTASGTITGVDLSSIVFNVLILHGSEVAVFSFDSITIGAGASLRVEGTRPLVLLSCGNITLAGKLDASAEGQEGGAGGFPGGAEDMPGSGCAGGRPGNSAGMLSTDSGGSGGSFGGQGGDGGFAYMIPGATAPPACSELASLVPLLGGSGGGGGGRDHSGYGGGGGGAIQITSGAVLTVTQDAVISANGAGGGGGLRQDPNYGAGGGGGSGGGILLEAVSVVLAGSLFANAGAGGGGVCTDVSGLDGENGHLDADRAQGGRGGDRGGDGGDGGAGSGEDGQDAGGCPTSGYNGGGGGGGSGFIRINALSAESVTVDGATATVSPSDDASGCSGLCSMGTVGLY